jgi:hypothetical protein
MPTIEQRYEGALAVIDEIAQLAGRLAIAVAASDPEAKRTLSCLRRDHIASCFRVAGDDASITTTLHELDHRLTTIGQIDKSQLPDLGSYVHSRRNPVRGAPQPSFSTPRRRRP